MNQQQEYEKEEQKSRGPMSQEIVNRLIQEERRKKRKNKNEEVNPHQEEKAKEGSEEEDWEMCEEADMQIEGKKQKGMTWGMLMLDRDETDNRGDGMTIMDEMEVEEWRY